MRAPYFERGIVQVKEMPPRDIGSLTPRKQQVLRQVAEGKHNKEIAHSMGISDQAVKGHLKVIYRELGVSNRMGAANVMLAAEDAQQIDHPDHVQGVALSSREAEIMKMLVSDDTGGITNKEIARKAHRSKGTVSHHLANAYKKLGASNRVEAIVRFRAQLGLTGPQA